MLQLLRRHPFVALVAVVAVVFAVYFLGGEDAGPAQKHLFATVEIGDIENAVTAAGSLIPRRVVDVGAQVSGLLEQLHVDMGDLVEMGDLLAEIDATVQINEVAAKKASIQALEAQLQAREAGLKLAQANAARQDRLMQENATSQADFEGAINSLASAQSSLISTQSQIEQARAELAQGEAQLGYTKIYSPATGTVVGLASFEGQTLNAKQVTPLILSVADLKTMTVMASVSEADVAQLHIGMPVYFKTLGSGERRWYSEVKQINPTPTITNNVVLYPVLFDVDNSDGILLTNMTAQVFFITSAARSVVKVPMGALAFADPKAAASKPVKAEPEQRRRGRRREPDPQAELQARAARIPRARLQQEPRAADVQVAREDGTLETRTIEIGVTNRIAAEVLSGLDPGERVVAGLLEERTRKRESVGIGELFDFD